MKNSFDKVDKETTNNNQLLIKEIENLKLNLVNQVKDMQFNLLTSFNKKIEELNNINMKNYSSLYDKINDLEKK